MGGQMYLTLTDAAQEKILPYMKEKAVLVLDLDDGVGRYSKVGNCALDTSFRLLLLDQMQDTADYGLTLDSSIGAIAVKDYSERYLDNQMTLDVDARLHTFVLTSPSGVLDSNVPLVDLRPEKQIEM